MEDFFIVFPATVRFLWVVASIILPIILFFKIWGMTNDIKKIEKIVNDFNNHYCSTNDIYKQYSRKYTPLELRRFLLLGDKETYKAAVISNFIANIEYGELSGFDDDEMKNISIVNDVKALQKQLDIIGEKVPTFISQLQTLYDFFHLLNTENTKPSTKECL